MVADGWVEICRGVGDGSPFRCGLLANSSASMAKSRARSVPRAQRRFIDVTNDLPSDVTNERIENHHDLYRFCRSSKVFC